jgi:hypothetical protein
MALTRPLEFLTHHKCEATGDSYLAKNDHLMPKMCDNPRGGNAQNTMESGYRECDGCFGGELEIVLQLQRV